MEIFLDLIIFPKLILAGSSYLIYNKNYILQDLSLHLHQCKSWLCSNCHFPKRWFLSAHLLSNLVIMAVKQQFWWIINQNKTCMPHFCTFYMFWNVCGIDKIQLAHATLILAVLPRPSSSFEIIWSIQFVYVSILPYLSMKPTSAL